MVIRARPGVFQGVPHSIIRNGLDPDRDLNAFTHVYLSWWTLKFQFGQHSKITWDTPNYARGPSHSPLQICTAVDICQRNIGSLTRPLSLLLVSLPIVLACFDCALVKHQSHLFSLLIVSTFVISWSPSRTKAGHKTGQRYRVSM